MASRIEEQFVMERLIPGSILEFGAGDCSFAKEVAKVRKITAIDLYKPEQISLSSPRLNFVHTDLMEFPIDETYDNIVALSAFEHVGIETYHFSNKCTDIGGLLQRTADKMMSLLSPEGRLLITVPFGSSNIYLVNKDGNNGLMGTIANACWGFRTMTLQELCDIFYKLVPTNTAAYTLMNKDDYFNPKSWKEISPLAHEECSNTQRGLLCITFERKNQ